MLSGAYPAVSLKQIRKLHPGGVELLAFGVDPIVQKKADKRAKAVAHENNFEAVARDGGRTGSTQVQANTTYSRPCAG